MAPYMIQNLVAEGREEITTVAAAEECARCGGLLVRSRYIDLLDDTGQLEFSAQRCVQCGDVVDPIILHNRVRQSELQTTKRMDALGHVA